MESKIGSVITCTGLGTIIGATIMKKINDSNKKSEPNISSYKPNPKLLKNQQLNRDVYVTGSQFLKSNEASNNFYSYKHKDETLSDFINSEPEFVTSDKIIEKLNVENNLVNNDIVKLIINENSTVFVESDKSINKCKNVNVILVNPCEEFNFTNINCDKLKKTQ